MERKHFIQYLLTAIASPFWTYAAPGENTDDPVDRLIREAGNASDEKKRANILQKLTALTDFSTQEKEVLKVLLDVSDRWGYGFEKYQNPEAEGNEGSGYLCGFFSRYKLDKRIFPDLDEGNRLFPLVALAWSRILVALMIQNGEIVEVEDTRRRYLAEISRLMNIAGKTFSENRLLKVYLGDYQPWGERVAPDPLAPDWANSQRMILEKLNYLIYWWIDHRQITGGQFGGGWGDDVEMWRSWIPVLLAFRDEKVIDSQRKLFEGLFRLSKMKKGYTSEFNDVEHTSEEYSDPLTCMIMLEPENKAWEDKALRVMDYIENLWTGTNEKGMVQFKSTWFSVEKVGGDVKGACDTPYHTRLVQPLMLIWQRTGNKRAGDFLKKWMTTWVEATFTEESGKPAGVIPASIHWPYGKPTGTGKNWWLPENSKTPYDFPVQQEVMYECFLQTYAVTNDEYFLRPIRFAGEKLLAGSGKEAPSFYREGSLDWALSVLKGKLTNPLAKYKALTGDNRYDTLLQSPSGGYAVFLSNGDMGVLTSLFERLQNSLSLPEEFYTTEVRWTDRLFAFSSYFAYAHAQSPPRFSSVDLFGALTGNLGEYRTMPTIGVKWLTHATEIAIVTEVNKPDEFRAKLFHFGNTARKMGATFYQLKNGAYELFIDDVKKGDSIFTVRERGFSFQLPPRRLCTLRVVPKR